MQYIFLYSDNGKQDPLFITNYATINVIDRLSRIDGVGQASLSGAQKYSMRIWFNAQRLNNLGLQPSDVVAAVQAQNVQAPIDVSAHSHFAGSAVSDEPADAGRLETPEQFGDIVIRSNPDGSLLRVRDVARTEMGAQSLDTHSRLNGKPAVSIAIYLSPGANAVRTSASVAKALDELSTRFPEGLKTRIVYDSSTFVGDTIHEVIRTIFEGFVLVILVVYLFLGSLRATIIPAVAIPVSLIGAFAVMIAMGYSSNTVSLLALVLAIGIVIDDAIVVVENVERVMEEEPEISPVEATKRRCGRSRGR